MIKVFSSEHCTPCEEVAELIRQGKFDGEEVDLVDIESQEGFKEFQDTVLSEGDAFVPIAYKGATRCDIKIEDGILHFNCGEALHPEPDQELPPHDSVPGENSEQ